LLINIQFFLTLELKKNHSTILKEKAMSWIQIFSNGFVCEMDDDKAVSGVDTKREVKKLIEALLKIVMLANL
jgi:hypothetical protein